MVKELRTASGKWLYVCGAKPFIEILQRNSSETSHQPEEDAGHTKITVSSLPSSIASLSTPPMRLFAATILDTFLASRTMREDREITH